MEMLNSSLKKMEENRRSVETQPSDKALEEEIQQIQGKVGKGEKEEKEKKEEKEVLRFMMTEKKEEISFF
jgi:hypothetical protein